MVTPAEQLYESVQRRPRPEDVAELVLSLVGDRMGVQERSVLLRAASGSLRRSASGYSSMASDFFRVVGADKMVRRAASVFSIPDPPSAVECLDVEKVRAFAARIGEPVSIVLGRHDFKADRLNREQRMAAGLDVRKREYNRRVRAVRRFAARLDSMVRNAEKYMASRVAKGAGASLVSLSDLEGDLDTACFVAYLSSRMGLRSVFTNRSQERAFDEVAEVLYRRARSSPTACWYAMALVHPEAEVLSRLTEEEKGRLLGVWTDVLSRISALLRTLHSENSFDLSTMVVRRGNDSSSWNAAAGAWNAARTHWISLVYALGAESILEHYCPGKAMRLMAADVVAWHSRSGGAVDPNTRVWADLPLPWVVFDDGAPCGLADVVAACTRHGVAARNWVSPPPKRAAVPFRPTPELVHGVSVSSPFLALRLRRAGYFGGKGVPEPVPVEVVRDACGSALVAVEPPA